MKEADFRWRVEVKQGDLTITCSNWFKSLIEAETWLKNFEPFEECEKNLILKNFNE